MELLSDAFRDGQAIPKQYTCDGADDLVPLRINGVRDDAVSLAVIVDDPDASGEIWVHWVVWNIPGDTRVLSAGLPSSAVQGINSGGKIGWSGPCPPSGMHRYVWHLYALDSEMDVSAGAKVEALREAMKGHVMEEAQLMGTYERT